MTERLGIGEELRRAREARGLSLDEVALQLKFLPRQIESLENERFERLPGPTIARGMVRNYARLLNLDPEPLVARMMPRQEQPAPAPIAGRTRDQVPVADSGRRASLIYGALSVAILVLAIAVVVGWQQERSAPEFVAPLQTQRPAEPEAPPAQAEAPPQDAAQEKPPQAAVAPAAEEKMQVAASKPPGDKAKAAEKPAPEAPKPKAEAEKVAAEKPPAEPAGSHRITLRLEEESWIEIRDGAGRLLVAALTPAGTERTVRGRAPFEIVIGNAQHVRMFYDDKPVDLKPHTRRDVARFTLK